MFNQARSAADGSNHMVAGLVDLMNYEGLWDTNSRSIYQDAIAEWAKELE